jgi:hypothetical protein
MSGVAKPNYPCGVKGDDALAVLVGEHLDTVSFVMDYVELRIGYSIFRALSEPHVRLRDGTNVTFPDPGSRDALCRLIDTEVISANEVGLGDAAQIVIRNDAGDVFAVSIGGDCEPEHAHLIPADERGNLVIADMYIW